MPTYLLTNEPTAYTSLWKMLETNPLWSSDLTTVGWGGKGETGYQPLQPGVDTDGIALLASLPTAFTQKGWRTENPLNGTFAAGTWTFDAVCDGEKYANVDIALWARLWKSPNADGSGATALSDWIASATQTIADNQTDVVYSWTAELAELTLTNEYLFVEFCMQFVTASGDAAGASIDFTCDEMPDTTTRERVITTTFTPIAVVETIVAKEFPMLYYAATPQELRSKVSGATVTSIAKDFPEALLKKGKASELRSKWE